MSFTPVPRTARSRDLVQQLRVKTEALGERPPPSQRGSYRVGVRTTAVHLFVTMSV